eukprot:sb/3470663/
MQRYIDDIQTIKPATIIHPIGGAGAGVDGKFLHFDSSVAKIDEMYSTILSGKPSRKTRRDANVGKADTTVMHYNNRPMTEMQLTIRSEDQVWNIATLRNAYENKVVGIRIYSNALDLIRRNLALKEARLSLLAKRLVNVNNLAGVQKLLNENEGKTLEGVASTSRKPDSASFTLPVVDAYSSHDSGYEGSNVFLDPAKYM